MNIRETIKSKCRKGKEGKDREKTITTEYQNFSAPNIELAMRDCYGIEVNSNGRRSEIHEL